MKNGRFTEEETVYLNSLDAVLETDGTTIRWNPCFRDEYLRRHALGEGPSRIFRSAGVGPEVIGRKRMERCCERWREYARRGGNPAPIAPAAGRPRPHEGPRLPGSRVYSERQVAKLEQKHLAQTEKLKERLQFQTDLKKRAQRTCEVRLEKKKKASEAKLKRAIASKDAEIAVLKAQVDALKANGALAKRTKRAPHATRKTERFEIIGALRAKDPSLNVRAACGALEVSRSGYYKWAASEPLRRAREAEDLVSKGLVEEAFMAHGFKKGSRMVVDTLRREQGVRMNRKKVVRIMRKFDIRFKRRRKSPYHPISLEGEPRIADNLLDRNFHQGVLRKVLVTDITYIASREGWCYLSCVLDAESNEPLSWQTSRSLAMPFVERTFAGLKGIKLAPGALAHSDMGCHYTSRAYRAALSELGLVQSMSRKGNCHDNACIESFFGRMKEQLGDTKSLSFEEVSCRVDDYMDYYTNHRRQERLGNLTPAEYAKQLAA